VLCKSSGIRPDLDSGILEIDNSEPRSAIGPSNRQWRALVSSPMAAASGERAMCAVALGRRNYPFMGSQTSAESAAIAYAMIETAKLNGVDRPGMAGRCACPHPRQQYRSHR